MASGLHLSSTSSCPCSYSAYSYNFKYTNASVTINGTTRVCFQTYTAASSYSNVCTASGVDTIEVSMSELAPTADESGQRQGGGCWKDWYAVVLAASLCLVVSASRGSMKTWGVRSWGVYETTAEGWYAAVWPELRCCYVVCCVHADR